MTDSILHPEISGLHYGCGKWGIGKTTWSVTAEIPEQTVLVDLDLGKSKWMRKFGLMYFTPPVEVAKVAQDGTFTLDMSGLADWFFNTVLPQAKGNHFIVDNVSPLEAAIGAVVLKNPAAYGINVKNAQNSVYGGVNPGIGNVWYGVMANLHQRFQLVTVTAHVGNPWIDGKPVLNKYNGKGNKTLMTLANLAVAIVPGVDPASRAGIVLKSAYQDFLLENGGLKPIPLIPPRLPSLDWNTFKDYLDNPRDFSRHLGANEIPSKAEIEMFAPEYSPEQLALVRSFKTYSETGEETVGEAPKGSTPTVIDNNVLDNAIVGLTGMDAKKALVAKFNELTNEQRRALQPKMNELLNSLS